MLSVTQLLSLQLQVSQLDIGGCRRLLDGVMKTISEKRTDQDFEKMWDDVVKFANENELHLPSVGSKRAVRVSSTLKDSIIIMSAIGQRQKKLLKLSSLLMLTDKSTLTSLIMR